MKSGIKFSEIREASPGMGEAALSGIIAQAKAPANGGIRDLEVQIAEYEERYGVSSQQMLEELSSGEREETEELLDWLMLIRLRERVESTRTR
jgi:hypothetical protein